MKKTIQLLVLLILFLPVSNNLIPKEINNKPTVSISDYTYWITLSTSKRHNKTCKWYKNSKGKCSDTKIGKACKICGG